MYRYESEDMDEAEAVGENESECQGDGAGVNWFTPASHIFFHNMHGKKLYLVHSTKII